MPWLCYTLLCSLPGLPGAGICQVSSNDGFGQAAAENMGASQSDLRTYLVRLLLFKSVFCLALVSKMPGLGMHAHIWVHGPFHACYVPSRHLGVWFQALTCEVLCETRMIADSTGFLQHWLTAYTYLVHLQGVHALTIPNQSGTGDSPTLS
jgi:hypothetical protein